jgi:hypothetical protein
LVRKIYYGEAFKAIVIRFLEWFAKWLKQLSNLAISLVAALIGLALVNKKAPMKLGGMV